MKLPLSLCLQSLVRRQSQKSSRVEFRDTPCFMRDGLDSISKMHMPALASGATISPMTNRRAFRLI